MKKVDYLEISLNENLTVEQYLEKECNKILSYHSYSPQYGFYKDIIMDALERCLYDGLIDVKTCEILQKRIRYPKNTDAKRIVAPILSLLERYKPRLKLIDLLYDIDLEKTYVLKYVSERMNDVLQDVNDFSDLGSGRPMLIIQLLEKALAHLDDPSRKCYYYLFLAKNALMIYTKYYRSGEADDLVDLYLEISEKVHYYDREFFKEYVQYYKDYLQEEISLEESTLFQINPSNSSNAPSDYGYLDYLNNYDKVFKSLASSGSSYIIYECNDRLMNSDLPYKLKESSSKDLFDLEMFYTKENFDISGAFIWYDTVDKDFVYYLSLRLFNETKMVINTFTNILTEEGLVDFYINKAFMVSLLDDGDKITYNRVLIENLENLKSYGFIEDVNKYYNMYRR